MTDGVSVIPGLGRLLNQADVVMPGNVRYSVANDPSVITITEKASDGAFSCIYI